MKNSASLLYSFILFVADFVALVLAFTLAYIVRVKFDDRPLIEPITAQAYIGVVAVLLVFWLIIYAVIGLYRTPVYENRFKEFSLLLIGSFIGILFLIGAEYVLNRPIFPARLVTAYGFLFAFLLTLLFRTITRAMRRTLFRFDIGITHVLLVGDTVITQELLHSLSQPRYGHKVIGVVTSAAASTKHSHVPHYKTFAEAIAHIPAHHIHSIVQAELFSDVTRNDEIVTYAQKNHIAYRFVPGNSSIFVGNIDVSLFEGIPTIAVHQTALVGWGRIAKRLFDIVVSGILLLVLSPVFLLLWIILSVAGGNPVFRQTRLSRYQNKITLFKFRTTLPAYTGLSPEQAFKKMGKPELARAYRSNGDFLDNDPRFGKFGALLRSMSLDELPQIFNVFRGDLSLVGPRPLVPEELNTFEQKNIILSVKPGLTGLAVISGRRNISFEERRKLDMYYAQNWSFFMDIVILLKTVVIVLRRAGAK